MPNCKLSLDVVGRHFHISSETVSFICNGRTVRICNQRVLTFLLTEFVKDYDISKFFIVVKQLVQLPDLRDLIDQFRKGLPMLTNACIIIEFV